MEVACSRLPLSIKLVSPFREKKKTCTYNAHIFLFFFIALQWNITYYRMPVIIPFPELTCNRQIVLHARHGVPGTIIQHYIVQLSFNFFFLTEKRFKAIRNRIALRKSFTADSTVPLNHRLRVILLNTILNLFRTSFSNANVYADRRIRQTFLNLYDNRLELRNITYMGSYR